MTRVEALARAMFFEHQHVPGEGDLSWDSLDGRSRAAWLDSGQTTLAALSPADRLAIAGITRTRIEDELDMHNCLSTGTCDCGDHERTSDYRDTETFNRHVAERLLAALATPVTPEGGEL